MQDDPKDQGRRKALECMLWAGTGLLWTVTGGVPRSAVIGSAQAQTAAAADGFRFVQISDTHLGFSAPPNPDPTATLHESLIAAAAYRPAMLLHTGDVSHLSRPGEFDRCVQVIGGTRIETRYVPGEHDVFDDEGRAFYERFAAGRATGGGHSFDMGGVHFIALNTVRGMRPGQPGQIGRLGEDQLRFLEQDLAGRGASTPIVVFSHMPLYAVWPDWGWTTTDGAPALALLRRFGSVTVLNGHIHQTLQKVEGTLAFHSGMSTAFPQAKPGEGRPGPIRDLPAERLRKTLGINAVTLVRGGAPLAVVERPLES